VQKRFDMIGEKARYFLQCKATLTPRQMASSAGYRSAGRAGSNAQSSCPLVASRATTRSNGVQKTSLPAAKIGVTSKELRVKAAPCRVLRHRYDRSRRPGASAILAFVISVAVE
jgi:hypothetical protein